VTQTRAPRPSGVIVSFLLSSVPSRDGHERTLGLDLPKKETVGGNILSPHASTDASSLAGTSGNNRFPRARGGDCLFLSQGLKLG